MCLRCYGKGKKRKCRVIKEMGIGDGKLLINALPSGSADDRSQRRVLSGMRPVLMIIIAFILILGPVDLADRRCPSFLSICLHLQLEGTGFCAIV